MNSYIFLFINKQISYFPEKINETTFSLTKNRGQLCINSIARKWILKFGIKHIPAEMLTGPVPAIDALLARRFGGT